jgi:phenylpropionate dioxygenase-like ring-hydroxylating dioxygenase large terminal subunit
VPCPDDFFHTYMGEDPVILTRDGQGRLHALLNMCRHRGNRVVRCDDGNAKRFMCTYHGWTYRNDGALDR